MRRSDGSGTEDHLAAGRDVDRAAVFDQSQAGDAVLGGGPGTATLMVPDPVIEQESDGLCGRRR